MERMADGSRTMTMGRSHNLNHRRGEAIQMESKRFGYFPQTFVWHGRRYDAQVVERCWTVSRRLVADVQRHYFRVRCAEGMFELYQDAKNNTWHVTQFEPALIRSAVIE
jgi:hypothetical protein